MGFILIEAFYFFFFAAKAPCSLRRISLGKYKDRSFLAAHYKNQVFQVIHFLSLVGRKISLVSRHFKISLSVILNCMARKILRG